MSSLAIVLLEALIVGVTTVVVGSLVSSLIAYIYSKASGKSWGIIPMILSLFLTGVFIHLGFEVAGLNKFYVQYKTK